MQTIFFIRLLFIYQIAGQMINLPQSHIDMSDTGYYFSLIQGTDWLDFIYVSSLTECIHQCNENYLCRTFDYNYEPNLCRLFQVEPSPGQIVHDQSFVSQVGSVQLFPDLYSAFNQPCDSSVMTRYLICDGNFFRCPWNAFWDGSICVKQKYAAEVCTNSNECWDNYYNLTCAAAPICTATGYSTNLCVLNQNKILLNYTSSSSQPYTFYSFNFTASATAITVTFSLMNKDAPWFLDDVTLIDLNTSSLPLIQNGDFETGNLTNWNYCNPNSTNNRSNIAQNGSQYSHSGQYFYFGAPYPSPDFLSQTVPTRMGNLHTLSFWFGQSATSNKNRFIVTIFA